MRKLPAISEMEHITSKEFGEHMDTIIDRVTREDIALAIDHEDKSFDIHLGDLLLRNSCGLSGA